MKLTPGTPLSARCLLFDMDGTLVDSTAAVERVWGRWAESHGIPFASFRHKMHGRRAIDIMRGIVPPHLDALAELQTIDAEELVETDGIVTIPGAAALLSSLPRCSWALVTSAQLPLARVRMAAAGLPMPDIVVSAEDISEGKPNPACYLLALERLGQRPDEAVVVEDAPAGIAAGLAAGCRTIALATTTSIDQLAGTEWLPDLSKLVLERTPPRQNSCRLHTITPWRQKRMEMARYSEKFKGRAVARLLPPESAAVDVVAREVGIGSGTLERWRDDVLSMPARGRAWTAAARLEAVIVTAALDETGKNAWCREHGVYPGELLKWRASATTALAEPEEIRATPQATRHDKKRIKELERELLRKDRALAETAALLVLSKKVAAIFNKGEDE